MEIKKAAVIGAGVMGTGIAAHLANAGVEVLLLDIVPEGASDRSALARGAIEKALKTEPAPFMSQRFAKRVTPGNLEDDLGKLADVDWIVEAVIERLDIKSSLYKKLDGVRKPGTVISSNTSTIPLKDLVEGQSAQFKSDFLITHFFNPPRYLRLLELVAGPDTRPEVVEAMTVFGDKALGKAVILCNDTPGFIGNRIGTFWMQSAINATLDLGLSVDEADAVLSRPMGLPKTGVFGLLDLVGIDLIPHIAASLLKSLPKDDWYSRDHRDVPLMNKMIADGYTGRKGKGGFYRINREGGGKVKESIDLKTGEYAKSQKSILESVDAAKAGLRALVEHPDKGGQLAWRVLKESLTYAASLVPEIAADIVKVDEAMRTGFGRKYGPFEMLDQLGTDWFADKLKAEGIPVPPLLEKARGRTFYKVENGKRYYLTTAGEYAELKRPDGVLLLDDVKLAGEPVAKNASASLWDIGDGVLCLEFTGKMNTLDELVFKMLQKAMTVIDGKTFKALVIYNEGSNFSVGANLGLAMFALNIGLYPQVEESVRLGQQTYKAMKYAPFPVVGAPSGMALGGGCEVLLHCDAVQAHAETYMGLVEVGVGVIPGWGGCKEMLQRNLSNKRRPNGPMPAVSNAFETIGTAKVAKSAIEAQELLYLRESDGVTMNRDRVLFEAKQKALSLVEGYQPPEAPVFNLPGPTAATIFNVTVEGFAMQGKATPHDVVVSRHLANVLSGGSHDMTETLTEDQVLDLERAAFMALVRTGGTIDRIENMLTTGKPLRN
jgi:3-hydroxyacyl-CoA dehydrogenase